MPNDPETTPPDNDRIPADMDATIAPGAGGVENDATMPIERGTSGADPKSDSVQSFSPRLERIGDCKIEKRLGVGGFGEVWLATQESDLLKRRVAIKLLKRGMDSDSVLARFDLADGHRIDEYVLRREFLRQHFGQGEPRRARD